LPPCSGKKPEKKKPSATLKKKGELKTTSAKPKRDGGNDFDLGDEGDMV